MEFQREPGRIYAEEEGRVIAEVTFPDRDGGGGYRPHICGRYAPVRAWRGAAPGGGRPNPRGGKARQGRRVPMPKSGLKGTRRRPICCAPERRREPPRRWEQHGAPGGVSRHHPGDDGLFVPGDCLWPFDAVQGVWAGMVRPHERHRFRRQYAVCGRHAADYGF